MYILDTTIEFQTIVLKYGLDVGDTVADDCFKLLQRVGSEDDEGIVCIDTGMWICLFDSVDDFVVHDIPQVWPQHRALWAAALQVDLFVVGPHCALHKVLLECAQQVVGDASLLQVL